MQTDSPAALTNKTAAIEMVETTIASEVAHCLGILINGITAKILTAIQAADLPTKAELEDLEGMIKRALAPRPLDPGSSPAHGGAPT